MGVSFVLLTGSTSFDVGSCISAKVRPPIVFDNLRECSIYSQMSGRITVVICLHKCLLDFFRIGDDYCRILPPHVFFLMDLPSFFDPCFYDFFVLVLPYLFICASSRR